MILFFLTRFWFKNGIFWESKPIFGVQHLKGKRIASNNQLKNDFTKIQNLVLNINEMLI